MDEFYHLTPVEFEFALTDFNERAEDNKIQSYNIMRLQTLFIVNAMGCKYESATELMPFPWDEVKHNKEDLKNIDWDSLDNIQNNLKDEGEVTDVQLKELNIYKNKQ